MCIRDRYYILLRLLILCQKDLLVAPEAYSAGDDIRLTIATGAINGKVRVWATMMSLDKDGTDVDGDSMTATFA